VRFPNQKRPTSYSSGVFGFYEGHPAIALKPEAASLKPETNYHSPEAKYLGPEAIYLNPEA